MIKVVLVVLGLLFGNTILCQNGKFTSNKNFENYNIELGFRNLKDAWKGPLSASLMVKKIANFSDVNYANYLRSYVSVNLKDDPITFYKYPEFAEYIPYEHFDISAGVGIERQYEKSFYGFYFGADLFIQHYQSKEGLGSYPYLRVGKITRNVKSFNVGLNSFIGFKVLLNDFLTVGFESGLGVTQYFSSYKEREIVEILQMTLGVLEHRGPIRSRSLKLDFLKIKLFTIGIQFGYK